MSKDREDDRTSILEDGYQDFLRRIENSFPSVDKALILEILRLEHFEPNWQGTTTIEIQYKKDNLNLEDKKNNIYERFDMLPMEKDDKTLRFKAKRMFLSDIEKLVEDDVDISYITGTAKPTEKGQYPSAQ